MKLKMATQTARETPGHGFAMVRLEDLEIGDLIGTGGFGKVNCAHHLQWGEVAVKTVLDAEVPSREKGKLQKEAEKLWSMSHPNIIRLIGVVMERKMCALVMEHMSHGSLSDFVCDYPVPFPLQVRMIYQIILGMNYLHTRNPALLHLDLKGQNVLIDEDFNIKLCDFGLSQWRSYSMLYSKQAAGTATHVPPEQWMDINCPRNVKFDVYAFGIVVWEMLAKERPFSNVNETSQIRVCVGHGQRPDMTKIPADTKPWLIDIITSSWSQEPDRRPNFSDLKNKVDPELMKCRDSIPAAKRQLSEQCETRRRADSGPHNSATRGQPVQDPAGRQGRMTGVSRGLHQDDQDIEVDTGLEEDVASLSLQVDGSLEQKSGSGDQRHREQKPVQRYTADSQERRPPPPGVHYLYSPGVNHNSIHVNTNQQLPMQNQSAGLHPDRQSGVSRVVDPRLVHTNPLGPIQRNTTEDLTRYYPEEERARSSNGSDITTDGEPVEADARPSSAGPVSFPHYAPAQGGYWLYSAPGVDPVFLPQAAMPGIPSPDFGAPSGGTGAGLNINTNRGTFSSGGSLASAVHHHSSGATTTFLNMKGVDGVQIGDKNVMYVGAPGGSTGAKGSPGSRRIVKKKITTSERVITTDDVDLMIKHLGSSWKRLARKLKFTDGQIDAISSDYDIDGLDEKIYQLFQKWKQRESTGATARKLAEALCEIGKADIAAVLPM